MTLLDRLLDSAVAALPTGVGDRIIIFGSAPMVFAGLKPDVKNDLDLFVAYDIFDRLVAAGYPRDERRRDVPCIALAKDVEMFKTWLGVGFPEVYAASKPREGSRGFRVASLEHVLAFKVARSLDKDREDIALLRQVLGA
jgi:hypothetical protein